MKSFLLLLLLFGISNATFAQNFSCISPENKTYFTNNIHYLRGMRIDSTAIDSSATTYYPYKTGRVDDYYNQYWVDTTGGSWFGKRIVETTSGITYFETKRNDTITIKNNADVNESWVFYNDTASNIIYKATVTALDTFTINGFTDSVKLIIIKALDTAANEIVTDPLDSIKMILSKTHGFIQAIDFYLFPYLPLTNSHPFGFDAYFPLANGDYYQMRKENLVFKRIGFLPVYRDVLSDFDIGDEFYATEKNSLPIGNSLYQTKNVITNKTNNGTEIVYEIHNWRKGYSNYINEGLIQVNDSSYSTSTVGHSIAFNLTKMPEEWSSSSVFYYNPDDTSFCVRSLSYSVNTSPIGPNGISNVATTGVINNTFKVKIGITYKSYNSFTSQPGVLQITHIDTVKKNNYKCDLNNQPVAIRTPEKNIDFKIYPNPTKDWLTIELPELSGKDNISITLFNLSGLRLERIETIKNKVLLNIQHKTPGMYLLEITTNSFSVVRKIIVE